MSDKQYPNCPVCGRAAPNDCFHADVCDDCYGMGQFIQDDALGTICEVCGIPVTFDPGLHVAMKCDCCNRWTIAIKLTAPTKIIQTSCIPGVKEIVHIGWYGNCINCGGASIAYTKKRRPRRKCPVCHQDWLMWTLMSDMVRDDEV